MFQKVPILLQKSFSADERIFLGPLVHSPRGDVRGPHRFVQKRPQTVVSILRTLAALEIAKNRPSRHSWAHSIFDGREQDVVDHLTPAHVACLHRFRDLVIHNGVQA